MRICLDEVKRCQEVTPKPNFLILLGDRYGWRPLPPEVPAGEWNRIAAHLDSLGDAGAQRLRALEAWYELDTNARSGSDPPGAWILASRARHVRGTDRYEDSRVWGAEIERPLRRTLEDAAAALELDQETRLKYGASATEQEISRGALTVPDAREHVFGFFRTIKNLPEDASAEPYRDDLVPDPVTGAMVLDRQAEARLRQLKEDKLAAALPRESIFRYDAQWSADGARQASPLQSGEPAQPFSTDHLDVLCRDVERVLSDVIRREIQGAEAARQQQKTTEVDEEIAAHDQFGRDRLRSRKWPDRSIFVGRSSALERIDQYLAGSDPRPLGLSGEPGSGKSALMAQAAEQAKQSHRDAVVVSRFIGWTPGSSVVRELLDKLCRQIARAYGREEATPSDDRELVQELPKRLALASPQKPLVVFLDGVDQLGDADHARKLTWLPWELPAHVHLVVSTSTEPGDTDAVIERRLPDDARFSLDDMPVDEADTLLRHWFDDVDRTLQGRLESERDAQGQWRHVLDAYGRCRRPLYLKLAFEEARRWRSFDPVGQTPLAPDIPQLVTQLFDRLSAPTHHGATLVAASLGYLMAARHGLTEDEMIQLLSRDRAVLDAIMKYHRPPEEKLPVVIWSRLYFDLAPYLTQRRADDTSLFAFYHRQLDAVARDRHLTPVKGLRHRALAEYFGEQLLFLGDGKAPNIRKLSELPYQQTHAGDMWDELYATLTDFDFLEAKCTHVAVTTEGSGADERRVYGGVYELQEDYRLALEHFPPDFATAGGQDPTPPDRMRDALFDWLRFLQSDSPVLRSWPELLRQQAANQPKESVVARHVERHLTSQGIGRPAWLRWINRATQRSACLMTLPGHESALADVKLTPDDELIVSADKSDSSGSLRSFSLSTGQELQSLRPYRGEPYVPVLVEKRHLVFRMRNGTIEAWDAEAGGDVIVARDPSDRFTALAATENGDWLITGSAAGWLKVWNHSDGTVLHHARAHEGPVASVLVRSTDRCIVSGGDDGALHLWSPVQGRSVRLEGHAGAVYRVAAADHAEVIASASRDGTIVVWDLRDGRRRHELTRSVRSVSFLAVTPDGRKTIAAWTDSHQRSWAVGQAPPAGVPAGSMVLSVLASDQRSFLASVSENALRVWDTATGTLTHTLEEGPRWVQAVALSPDRSRVISANDSDRLSIREIDTGRVLGIFEGHAHGVRAIATTRDGRRLVTGGADRMIKVWDATSTERFSRPQHAESVTQLALTPDAAHLVSGAWNGTMTLWRTASGEPERHCAEHNGPVQAVAISLDGKWLASGSQDGIIHVYALASGELVHVLQGHRNRPSKLSPHITMPAEILALAITPDGKRLVSASGDSTLIVWELASGRALWTLRGHESGVNRLILSSDGHRAVSSGYDRTLRVWNLDRGRQVRKLKVRRYPYADWQGIAMSPDGRRIFATTTTALSVWTDGKRRPQRFPTDEVDLKTLVITADGRHLASLGAHGVRHARGLEWVPSIATWTTEDLSAMRLLKGHRGRLSAIAVTSDSRHVIAGAKEHGIVVWDLDSGAAMARWIGTDEVRSVATCAGFVAVGDAAGQVHVLELNGIDCDARNVRTVAAGASRRRFWPFFPWRRSARAAE